MDPDKFQESLPFLTSDQDDRETFSLRKEKKAYKHLFGWSSILMLTCVVLSNLFTLTFTNWTWNRNIDNFCALYTSQSWSESCFPAFSLLDIDVDRAGPVMNDLDIKYTTIRFNGTFFKNTIYRQAPSPEVDQAWRDLGIECRFVLTFPRVSFFSVRCSIFLPLGLIQEMGKG